MGVPSVAISMAVATPPYDFIPAAEFALRNLQIFRELGTDDHFMNVNIPIGATRETLPVITFPSRRIYGQELSQYQARERGHLLLHQRGAAGRASRGRLDCNASRAGVHLHFPHPRAPPQLGLHRGSYRGVKFS